MNKKLPITLAFLLCISITFAQSTLSAYKYVIVPNRFDSFKSKDQYQLNSMTKFMLEKQGFIALMIGDDRPEDLIRNSCLALRVNVINNSGALTTKLVFELQNCYDKVVFTSVEGKSKEKVYQKSYQQALRNTFTPIKNKKHVFNPDKAINKGKVSAKEKVKNIEFKETETTVSMDKVIAKSYKNEDFTFLLIPQERGFLAYVSQISSDNYAVGEQIGVLTNTSRVNTFKVIWKYTDDKVYNTVGYINQVGDLVVDIVEGDKTDTIIFKVE